MKKINTKDLLNFKKKFINKSKNKCFFFDRDNTLIHDKGYTYKKKDLRWKRGVVNAIKFLNSKNFLVIVITNQSGVARGYFKEKDVKIFHKYMNEILMSKKAVINDFFYCPYHIKGIGKYKKDSSDRKPKNGMIKKAAKKWNIDLNKSFFIGDSIKDKLAAKKSNLKFYKTINNLNLLVKKIIKHNESIKEN